MKREAYGPLVIMGNRTCFCELAFALIRGLAFWKELKGRPVPWSLELRSAPHVTAGFWAIEIRRIVPSNQRELTRAQVCRTLLFPMCLCTISHKKRAPAGLQSYTAISCRFWRGLLFITEAVISFPSLQFIPLLLAVL